ncbi:MAG: hypothetical protein ACRC28_01330 [Clostridium sp.]|uniref:hypothetical protein n=1 Tax=Clostridium sp. TaxID=1506 RepID=UPI003F3BECAC
MLKIFKNIIMISLKLILAVLWINPFVGELLVLSSFGSGNIYFIVMVAFVAIIFSIILSLFFLYKDNVRMTTLFGIINMISLIIILYDQYHNRCAFSNLPNDAILTVLLPVPMIILSIISKNLIYIYKKRNN